MSTIIRLAYGVTLTGAMLFFTGPVYGQDAPSAYELGLRMSNIEKRLERLEQSATSGAAVQNEIAAIRRDLHSLHQQVSRLSPRELGAMQRHMTELSSSLERLAIQLRASVPDRSNPPRGDTRAVASLQSFIKQIGEEKWRVVFYKGPGWYDTRLPYAGNCLYEISSVANTGKYEVTTGSRTFWFDSGFNSTETLNSPQAGTIQIRVNDESPHRVMVVEISRRVPAVGYCYGPVLQPLRPGKNMCDITYPMLGDDTPPIVQGLNSIAPLFGASPTVSDHKSGYNPACPPGSLGGPPVKGSSSPTTDQRSTGTNSLFGEDRGARIRRILQTPGIALKDALAEIDRLDREALEQSTQGRRAPQ